MSHHDSSNVSHDPIVHVHGIPTQLKYYHPDTSDMVVAKPTDHSLDPASPRHAGGAPVQKLHRRGEYEPEDDLELGC
jgi:hypothetical protein